MHGRLQKYVSSEIGGTCFRRCDTFSKNRKVEQMGTQIPGNDIK